ncbi:immunity 22 family protein [Enterocloster clostridioformis]|uniref:immunity 22 family protein n=2 Tax=Enterocloster clostridioformis TaxID=1531 RepID=UPI00048796EE|nr:immunity 22 family protein [Enterocloster clostridioformis]
MKDINNYFDKDNYASLWLCSTSSEKVLREYVHIDYDKVENEEIPFELGCDFLISWYDEDFLEISYKPNIKGWDLLEGHSYMKDLLPKLIDKFQDVMDDKFNSVILIYNLDYDGSVREIENQYGYFKFVGSFEYR